MSEQTFTEVLPFWQVQGLASFCKAKGDWLQYDKIHLSFVKHEGKPSCKQVLSIEGAVKIHGKDGALFLSDIILSGAAKKLAEASRNASGGGYSKSFFESKGGTIASRSKNGKCMFREFSVGPGSKSDYVFTMETCEGEENATGGIQPLAGAKKDKIFVPLSSGDLFDFARSIQTEYIAHRTFCISKAHSNTAGHFATPAPVAMPQPSAVQAPIPEVTTDKHQRVCVIVDTSNTFNGGIPVVTTLSGSIPTIQEATKVLLRESGKAYIADAGDYAKATELCKRKEKGTALIHYRGKEDPRIECAVVISIVDIQ